MNELKSIQINQLLRVLEAMEKTKRLLVTNRREWDLDLDHPDIWNMEESILLGYELLACYGAVRTKTQLANMIFLQRMFVTQNSELLLVDMWITL